MTYDLALPRGSRLPALKEPISWHKFAPETFDLGREVLPLVADISMKICTAELCTAERCLVEGGARLLREGAVDEVEPQVLAAARQFAAVG